MKQKVTKRTKTSKTNKKSSAKNMRILIFALIFIFLGGLVLSHFVKKDSETYVTSYSDCINSANSKISDTYPKQCKSTDKITFIEPITTPIDTSNWKKFDTHLGVLFLCPPKTICTSNYKTMANGAGLEIELITSENFQKSIIRHSGFNSPLLWYQALAEHNSEALTVPKQDLKYIPGTDAVGYPLYNQFDRSTIKEIKHNNWTGIEVTDKDDSVVTIFIPQQDQNILRIYYSKHSNYQDTILKTILDSIEIN